MQVSIRRILWLGVSHQVHTRVEMCHAHRLAAIVGRSTIEAVAQVRIQQTVATLHDGRRHFLMGSCLVPAVCQHLSEVDIVIRPDGVIVGLIVCLVGIGTLFCRLRNSTARIAEVTVSEPILDIFLTIIA